MNYTYYEKKKSQQILAYSPQPHMNTIQTTVSNPFHFLSLDRSSQSRILTGSCSKHKGLPVQSGCSEIVTGSILHYLRQPQLRHQQLKVGQARGPQTQGNSTTDLKPFSRSSRFSPYPVRILLNTHSPSFFFFSFFLFTSTPAAVW